MIDTTTIRVTATSLKAFDTCPRQYALLHVEPVPFKERLVTAAGAFGSTLHKTLADFIRKGGHQLIDSDGLLSILLDHWDARPFPGPDVELTYFRRAKEILERFHGDPCSTTLCEELGVERFASWLKPRQGMTVSGRIDRIVRYEDGVIEAIDYKTARDVLTPERMASDFQSLCYRSLLGHRFFRTDPTKVRITNLYLDSLTPVTVTYTRDTFTRHWQAITTTVADIRAANRAMSEGATLEEAFPERPGPSCRICSVRHHCPSGSRAKATLPEATRGQGAIAS
jgi:RecB family exonuclease